MAASSVKVRLIGVRETERALAGMKDASKKRVLRPAIKEGAKIVNQAAKVNAASSNFEDSLGGIRRSIGIKTGTIKRGGGVYAIVGARKGQGEKPDERVKGGVRKPFHYLHLVEGGTKPHMVGSRHHPGAKAIPILKPAYEENKTQIETIVRVRLAQEIEKEARLQAAKAAAKAVR
jgi:HK97 gp10 family phage protein